MPGSFDPFKGQIFGENGAWSMVDLALFRVSLVLLHLRLSPFKLVESQCFQGLEQTFFQAGELLGTFLPGQQP